MQAVEEKQLNFHLPAETLAVGVIHNPPASLGIGRLRTRRFESPFGSSGRIGVLTKTFLPKVLMDALSAG